MLDEEYFLKSELHAQGLRAEAPEGSLRVRPPAHPQGPGRIQDWVRSFCPKQLQPHEKRGEGSPTSWPPPRFFPGAQARGAAGCERRHDILFLGPAAPPAPLLILSFPGC